MAVVLYHTELFPVSNNSFFYFAVTVHSHYNNINEHDIALPEQPFPLLEGIIE